MRQRLFVLLMCVTVTFSSACVASKKFVRTEVKTSSDALNARIDTTDSNVKETRDSVDRVNQRVSTVDGRVSELDSKTTQAVTTLNAGVQSVDQKAQQAQSAANRTATDLSVLDKKFQGRNQYSVAAEKAVQFGFDSAKLDAKFNSVLDEIADMVMSNPDAIIVLEGHTDSRGNAEYNLRLGERRVEAVRHYLAVEKNVPVYKIHDVSFGAARPITSNDSKDGREKNRAVTMMVLVPANSDVAQGQ